MKKIRPNEQRANYVIIFLWVCLVLEFVILVSNYLQFDLLLLVQNEGEYTMNDLESNDFRVTLLFWVNLFFYIVTAVLFIMWFRRAYFNLHINVRHLNQSEGWAAGAWFVPILNLYRPYQIMKELYLETKYFLKRSFGKEVELSISYVTSWWVLWLLSGFLGRISMQFLKKENNIENLISATEVDIAINLIGIPLTLVTIHVVKKYIEVEQIMYDLITDEIQKPKSLELE